VLLRPHLCFGGVRSHQARLLNHPRRLDQRHDIIYIIIYIYIYLSPAQLYTRTHVLLYTCYFLSVNFNSEMNTHADKSMNHRHPHRIHNSIGKLVSNLPENICPLAPMRLREKPRGHRLLENYKKNKPETKKIAKKMKKMKRNSSVLWGATVSPRPAPRPP